MKHLSFLIFFIGVYSCSNKNNTPNVDPPESPITLDTCLVDTLCKQLEQAYQFDSLALLDTFIENWHRNVQPLSIDSLDNEIEKDIYEIYKLLVKPWDLESISDKQTIDLSTSDNAIVPTMVYYNISTNEGVNLIKRLKPPLRPSKHSRILYLTAEYDSVLTRFLEPELFKTRKNGLASYHNNRSKFLKNRLDLTLGDNGNYWHFTYPDFILIGFIDNRDSAEVTYNLDCTSWAAHYNKQNDNWTLSDIEFCAIE